MAIVKCCAPGFHFVSIFVSTVHLRGSLVCFLCSRFKFKDETEELAVAAKDSGAGIEGLSQRRMEGLLADSGDPAPFFRQGESGYAPDVPASKREEDLGDASPTWMSQRLPPPSIFIFYLFIFLFLRGGDMRISEWRRHH